MALFIWENKWRAIQLSDSGHVRRKQDTHPFRLLANVEIWRSGWQFVQ
jgi:hypothetical protein